MAKPIKVTILGDVANLTSNLDKGEKSVGGFGASIDGLASHVGAAVGKLAAVGVAVSQVGGAFSTALENEALVDKLSAQLGAVGPQAERLGDAAGALFAKGYGTGMEQITESIRSVVQNIDGLGNASDATLQRIAGKATNVAQIWDQDLGGTARAVGQMIRNGLVRDADEGFDVLVRGLQNGADKAGDLMDTMNEYSTQFRDLGLTGAQAMGLMSQGLQAGARDADTVADALKEFAIRAKDGSKTTADGFSAIGLSAKDMARVFAEGGPPAAQALDTVLDRVRAIEDPVKRSQVAVALFGTKAEDLQQSLYALDPSAAVGSLGTVAGAADAAGDAFHDNAQARITAFLRTLQTGFTTALGAYVIPAVERLVSVATTVLGPTFNTAGTLLSTVVIPAFRGLSEWISANQTPILVVAGVITAVFLPALIRMGIESTVTLAKNVALWTGTKLAALGSLAAQSAEIVAFVARMVWMGAQALIQGARVAAGWVMAMGPVGWVIAAVVALAALIAANWEAVRDWTVRAWTSVSNAVSTAVTAVRDWVLARIRDVLSFFEWLGALPGKAATWFGGLKDAAVSKLGDLLDWARSLPGRLFDALLSIHGRMIEVGLNIVRGVVNGLGQAASWIKDKLLSLAKAAWDSVLGFFGINSPAREGVWAGRMIGLGLANGIIAMVGTVSAASDQLADAVALPSLDPPAVAVSAPSRPLPGAPFGEPTHDPRGPATGAGPATWGTPTGPVVTVNVTTDADPHAIGAAVAWSLRTGGR